MGGDRGEYRLGAMTLALVGATLALSLIMGGCGSSDSDGEDLMTVAGTCPPVDARKADATLPQDEQARVLALIAADDDVQRILDGKTCELRDIGRWSDFGGVVDLRFNELESFPMQEWPVVDYRPGHKPPYVSHRFHFAAEQIDLMMISVDLTRSRVVGIDPWGDEAKITPGADLSRHAEPPTGY
jgi:hypothetical protein